MFSVAAGEIKQFAEAPVWFCKQRQFVLTIGLKRDAF